MSLLKTTVEGFDTTSGKIFNYFIQTLIILSLISFSVETVPNLSKSTKDFLRLFEIISIAIFTVEYSLRIIVAENKLKYIFSFYGLIDLFSILPFYLTKAIDLRGLRAFRLFRLFRAFKLVRYNNAIKRLVDSFLYVKNELVVFLIVVLFLIFISSVGIYYFENPVQPKVFSSIFDCMWWAVVTLTTVGYGDVFPITLSGKILTFVILMIGIGVVSVPTALIASALTKSISDEEKNK
ncbi:MAG: ion transporter [Bacteroidetes bacterium]|nr:ion transporter [Bacteroidota bacterium]